MGTPDQPAMWLRLCHCSSPICEMSAVGQLEAALLRSLTIVDDGHAFATNSQCERLVGIVSDRRVRGVGRGPEAVFENGHVDSEPPVPSAIRLTRRLPDARGSTGPRSGCPRRPASTGRIDTGARSRRSLPRGRSPRGTVSRLEDEVVWCQGECSVELDLEIGNGVAVYIA
jgi:hypothetical protein